MLVPAAPTCASLNKKDGTTFSEASDFLMVKLIQLKLTTNSQSINILQVKTYGTFLLVSKLLVLFFECQ